MAKKKKEQVKYNPSLSSVKRFGKARGAVIGRQTMVLTLIYGIISIVILALYISGFFLGKDASEGGAATSSVCLTTSFFGIFLFMFNSSIPSDKQDLDTARGALSGGCASVSEVFMHMPVTKLDIYKHSFKYFILAEVVVLAGSIASNIAMAVTDKYEVFAGMSAMTSILSATMILFVYLFMFKIFKNIPKKVEKTLTIIGVIIFYIVWFGTMIFEDASAKAVEILAPLAGIPALCISIVTFIAVLLIHKLYTEKRVANTAWYDR